MNPCGKVWYTATEASMQVRKMRPNDKKAYMLSIYECTDCEGWHVGHNYKMAQSPISICIGEMR